MTTTFRRTKIVATIGPASRSPTVLRALVQAGMNVARLNFSHGNYVDHARTVADLRCVAAELDTPVTLLQDLQGPKVRVGTLPDGQVNLTEGERVTFIPVADFSGQAGCVPIDYPKLASGARPGMNVLLDDGLLELVVEDIQAPAVVCRVVAGGCLKSRKGVILPTGRLEIPSLTEKDREDLNFGISQGVDWVALSFVRCAEDVRTLKAVLAQHAVAIPVLAKIEKPEAVESLEEILEEVDGLMVARGDLGVEMSPEKVPMAQKRIIRACNERGLPVITATQMLESMINEPRPTRAEASDVANAIYDGTDCVMLSGESAVGKYPVKAVEMMARIAREVEPHVPHVQHPLPPRSDETRAISRAITAIDKTVNLRCIAAFTDTGYTARLVSAERPRSAVVAFTPSQQVIHRLNLLWGVQPVLADFTASTFEEVLRQAETVLKSRGLAVPGDKVLVVAGLPMGHQSGTNFVKILTVSGQA